ncbi:MAG TPA: oligosaccharide flippase family protein [Nitrospirales bacterium]|nr:oligosaccharide flippase family protein [Nitrospirales bacterium]
MNIQSDMKRLFKHSSIYALGGIVNRAGAFILLPLYTSYLTPSEYGTLELVYGVTALVSSLLGVGLAHATLRFYFEFQDENERKFLVSTTLVGSGGIACTGVALLWFAAPILSGVLLASAQDANLLQLGFLILILQLSTEIGLAYFRAREYSIRFVVASFLRLVLQVGCNYYTVAVLEWGVWGILLGNLMSVGVSWGYVVGTTVYECGIRFHQSKFRQVLAYSFPFLLSTIVGVVVLYSDRFLLKALYGLEAVGLYALALKFVELGNVLVLEPFRNSYGSFRFSIMKNENVKEIQAQIVIYMAATVGLLALGISVFSPGVMRIMTTQEYWPAERLIPILAAGLLVSSLGYPFQTGILYMKKTKYMFYVTAIAGVVKILLSIAMIPYLGAIGASLAFLMAEFVSVSCMLFYSQQLFPIQYDYKALATIGGICGVLLAVIWGILYVGYGFFLGGAVAILICYPFLVIGAGGLNRSEVKAGWQCAVKEIKQVWGTVR